MSKQNAKDYILINYGEKKNSILRSKNRRKRKTKEISLSNFLEFLLKIISLVVI